MDKLRRRVLSCATAVARSKFGAFAILAGANLLGLTVVVIVFELVFGHWFTPYYPPPGAIFDRTFQFRQQLYEPHGVVTYIRDRYGLRGAGGPLERSELVTVGGSTSAWLPKRSAASMRPTVTSSIWRAE